MLLKDATDKLKKFLEEVHIQPKSGGAKVACIDKLLIGGGGGGGGGGN